MKYDISKETFKKYWTEIITTDIGQSTAAKTTDFFRSFSSYSNKNEKTFYFRKEDLFYNLCTYSDSKNYGLLS